MVLFSLIIFPQNQNPSDDILNYKTLSDIIFIYLFIGYNQRAETLKQNITEINLYPLSH